MEVVDAVKIHVFSVPGKGGFPHAKVQVWSVDPLDGDTTVLFNHIQDGVQVADIPLLYILKRYNDFNIRVMGCEYLSLNKINRSYVLWFAHTDAIS